MKIDVREHKTRIALAKKFFPDAQVEMLDVGDYVDGNLGVEWKGADFVDSIRGHMFQQIPELQSSYNVPLLMVEKSFGQLRKEMVRHDWDDPYAGVYGTVASLVARHAVPLFVEKEEWGFELLPYLVRKANDEKDRTPYTSIRGRGIPRDEISSPQVKLRTTTKDRKHIPTIAEYQLSILTGFPNMSVIRAKQIIEEYKSLLRFFNTSPDDVKRRVKGVDTLANLWHKIIKWERPEEKNVSEEFVEW